MIYLQKDRKSWCSSSGVTLEHMLVRIVTSELVRDANTKFSWLIIQVCSELQRPGHSEQVCNLLISCFWPIKFHCNLNYSHG